MNQPPRLVDPDLLEALPIAFLILAKVLGQTAAKNRVHQHLEDALANNPAAQSLSERQRLDVWRRCQMILDHAYTEPESQ